MSSGFLTPFLSMVGMMSRRTNKLWCSKVVDTLGKIMLAAVSAGASVLIEVYANFVCDSFEGQLFTSPVPHCSISI